MIHFSPSSTCSICGFILKAATDKSFLCVCLTWIMKSFSSSTSHTHLTTSHSSVSVPTGQEGVSSPLSAVSVDQSLPSSTKSTESQFLNFYIVSVFVILVCVCVFPPCMCVFWCSVESFRVIGGLSELSSSLLQKPDEQKSEATKWLDAECSHERCHTCSGAQ